jgi:hypothetical protein
VQGSAATPSHQFTLGALGTLARTLGRDVQEAV